MQWDHGGVNSYRMGAEGKFDLEMTGEEPTIPPPPPSEDESTTPEQEDEECDEEVWPNVALSVQCTSVFCSTCTISNIIYVFVCFSKRCTYLRFYVQYTKLLFTRVFLVVMINEF